MSSIEEKLSVIAQNQQKVYDAGYAKSTNADLAKEEERLRYWDAITYGGKRENYAYAFSYGNYSGIDFIKPIYPVTDAVCLFSRHKGPTLPTNIDLSRIKGAITYLFYYTNLEEIYDVHLPVQSSYFQTFRGSTLLKKIEIIRVNENTTFSATFHLCDSLEEVRFEGIIGNDIEFTESTRLTRETILHVIDHLKDFSSTNISRTLTLGWANLAKLTDEEIQTAIDKGWILK